MFQNIQDKVVRFVSDNPASIQVLALCTVTAGVTGFQKFYRVGQAAKRAQEKARRDAEADARLPRFGHGAFMDGLIAMPPTMDMSACESLGTLAGFAVPQQTETERNFAELMRACRRLPAEVDDWPGMQKQLDNLRERVDLLSRTHYTVEERDDGLAVIEDLWSEAAQLRKKLRARYQREALVPQMASGANAMPFDAAAPEDSEAGAPADDDKARSPVARRRNMASGVTGTPATVISSQPPPFRLHRSMYRNLRTALANALATCDGAGRLTHNEERRLGVAIAGLTGGSYPTHFSHGGPLERRYDVRHVLMRATERMTVWHRDAVREAAETCLRTLENA